MINIAASALLEPARATRPISGVSPDGHCVLILRDADKDSYLLDVICEFFNIGVEHVESDEHLAPLLNAFRPLAVIADLEGGGQDGFNVMMTVAAHDRDIPVLLLTKPDPSLMGAIDAVQEVCGLTKVMTLGDATEIGPLVDFLCHAARDAGIPRLMRV